MDRNASLEEGYDEKLLAVKKPIANNKSYRPTRYVHVERREEIKEARLKLPIINEEQTIMETI